MATRLSQTLTSGGVKSIQRGSLSYTNTRVTVDINPVNVDKSMILIEEGGGTLAGFVDGRNDQLEFQWDNTQVVLQRWQIVEFY